MQVQTASKWANPKSVEEITSLFCSYLESHRGDSVVLVTPFTSGPLSSESLTILSELLTITKRGWWTVGSQPAVDGATSNNETVGWGPHGGWVYQKAFVEFFADEEDIVQIENLVNKKGNGVVTFFAADGAVSSFA